MDEKKKAKSKRMGEEAILKAYPHAIPNTLHFLPNENKQAVRIKCVEEDCKNERVVRTSDLWQVKRCRPCTTKARQGRAKARRAAKKADAASPA
jgi:hypothetical protein